MKEIKIPVTLGKRERLLKSVDTAIKMDNDVLTILGKHLKESPKDRDDEYSSIEEELVDYNLTVLRKHIFGISYNWDKVDSLYELEILIGAKATYINMNNKEDAIKVHSELVEWWLS